MKSQTSLQVAWRNNDSRSIAKKIKFEFQSKHQAFNPRMKNFSIKVLLTFILFHKAALQNDPTQLVEFRCTRSSTLSQSVTALCEAIDWRVRVWLSVWQLINGTELRDRISLYVSRTQYPPKTTEKDVNCANTEAVKSSGSLLRIDESYCGCLGREWLEYI